MLDVEHLLLSRSDMESDDKYFVESGRVYTHLLWLSGEINSGAGDVAGGAEYRPTAQAVATLGQIERELSAARSRYGQMMRAEGAEFGGAARGGAGVAGGR
jgi:hypothetical protein